MAAVAAMLDFRWEQFQLFLIYQVTQIVSIKFRVIGFSVKEKKFQTDSQMVAMVVILDFRLEWR